MTTHFTHRGCKVETTYIGQPNGQYRTRIVLSTSPFSDLSLELEGKQGTVIGTRAKVAKLAPRFRR